MKIAASLLLAGSLIACQQDNTTPEQERPPIAELLHEQMGSLYESDIEEQIGYRIHHLDNAELAEGVMGPEACDEIEQQLQPVCNQLMADEESDYCFGQATFFYAHQIPRCAVRMVTSANYPAELSDVFVMDFTGEAASEAATLCGNGELDEGEACDDGNHELWDGCDSHCEVEPFTGCETLIEANFAEAGIAQVSSDTWKGPRSHLMVNRGNAMAPMTTGLCKNAITTAQETCLDLTAQMPFVYHCNANGSYDAGVCNVRLEAYFSGLDEDTGVFTTSLSGILAFSIR